MPTRHLSDEQRQRYASFAAAPSPHQLSRYFHLDGGDREIIDELRGDHNRLGFALMLGSARFLGAFPGAACDIPRSVTAFLINQLGLPPEVQFKGYFDHGGQRLRHLALIRERYGFTEFADNGPARFRLTRSSSGDTTSPCQTPSSTAVSGRSGTLIPHGSFEQPYAAFLFRSAAQA